MSSGLIQTDIRYMETVIQIKVQMKQLAECSLILHLYQTV